ncbi:MAG: bacteriohemerythrin [Clostridiales bacterium]|nr:bacteriohemerythrin [Clostridiales bacterium]
MSIKWTKNLEVGIEDIDNQHKELFKRIDDLFNACNAKLGKQEIGHTLDYLCDYVHTHFQNEEQYQRKYNYPEYPMHAKIHEQFLNEVNDLKSEFDKNGPTLGFIIKFNKKVVDWLINHIGKLDKKFGEFVKAQNK